MYVAVVVLGKYVLVVSLCLLMVEVLGDVLTFCVELIIVVLLSDILCMFVIVFTLMEVAVDVNLVNVLELVLVTDALYPLFSLFITAVGVTLTEIDVLLIFCVLFV